MENSLFYLPETASSALTAYPTCPMSQEDAVATKACPSAERLLAAAAKGAFKAALGIQPGSICRALLFETHVEIFSLPAGRAADRAPD